MFNKLSDNEVFEKLIWYWMFPKSLDNIFTSLDYKDLVLRDVSNLNLVIPKKTNFKTTTYKQTRNNNAARYMWIPHPLWYTELSKCIRDNWEKIKAMTLKDNTNYEKISLITPRDNDEMRLIQLSKYDIETYQDTFRLVFNKSIPEDKNIIVNNQFLKKYVAKSDISNFFWSIYSHSISWAILWKREAKEKKFDKTLWPNKLDKASRILRNDETNWVPIWPDSSNIISELILSRVDAKLLRKWYVFVRYIDDYSCYCNSKEQAESFIQDLANELEKYELKINTNKTYIKSLPEEIQDVNFSKINEFVFPEEINSNNLSKVVDYLDMAVRISERNNEYAPFKYALIRLGNNLKIIEKDCYLHIIKYVGNICYIHPYLIDSIEKILWYWLEKFNNSREIRTYIRKLLTWIINEHIKLNKSDVITWCIYMAIKYSIKLDNYSVIKNRILKNLDSIPLLMFIIYSHINEYSLYSYDKVILKMDQEENWLLVYEYYKLVNEKWIKSSVAINEYKQFYDYLILNNISFLNNIIQSRLNWSPYAHEISAEDIPF